MAIRDILPFKVSFGGEAAPDPIEQQLGHTAPEPRPGEEPMPRIGMAPFGQSGRANFWGLPQSDELNAELVGPNGLRRFNEMYRTDPHVRRLVLAAWSPLVAGTWTLEPYGGEDTTAKDKEIADTIWWLLTEFMSPSFQGHLLEIGPLLLRSGFTSCEQIWDTVDYKGKTLYAPRKLMTQMPTSIWRWWQDDFAELTHIGQILPNRSDVVIPASELVYYRLGAEGDNWMGTSLLRHAYKPWYLKDKLERIDAIGQERKAVGVPVCYPPTSASGQVKAELEALLASLHMSDVAYIMMPGPKAGSQGSQGVPQEEWLIDIIQFDSSSGEGIMNSIAYHQTGIAASFLTDFLELGHHQVGARATAEVQEDPFLTAVNGALLPPVLPPLNKLVDRIRRRNWENAEGSPQLKLTLHDEASLSEIAAYVTPLIQAEAMQVDPELEDYLRDRAGLPKADPNIRAQKIAAQKAGMDAAAKLAATGETPNEEPPSPNADPASTGQGTPALAKPAQRPQPNAIAGAIKNAGKIPASGKQLDTAAGAIAGGVIVKAVDTGRVLIVQRTPDDTDAPDVFASWEFPGGKLDPADPSAWAGARREWGEEVGCELPACRTLGDFTSPDGNYHAFVVEIASESDVPIARPDRNEVAQLTWKDPDALAGAAMSDRAKLLLPGLDKILGSPRQLDAAPPPPNLRPADSDTERCFTCEMYASGVCWGYGNFPTQPGWVCDAWAQDSDPDADGDDDLDPIALSAAAAVPSAQWFERLIKDNRLREALDGARDQIQTACTPPVLLLARQLAYQTANGTPVDQATQPPAELVDALTGHYEGLYQLGHETVQDELAHQRAAMAKMLDDPSGPDPAAAGAASRLARARQRGEHSARNVLAAINERLGRDQITGLKDAPALQALAEAAAQAQLRKEALSNVAPMINDGRYDAARASNVAGGIYTSVMDERSCDPCIAADTGDVIPVAEAEALGPPNPDCDGGDFCRCLILWVLSDDPAALAAVS